MGPCEYFLTAEGLIERDKLNMANPPPLKPEPVKKTSEVTFETGVRSIGDYLQMPIIKPLE